MNTKTRRDELLSTIAIDLIPNEMLVPRLTPEKLKQAADELAQLAKKQGQAKSADRPALIPVILWQGGGDLP